MNSEMKNMAYWKAKNQASHTSPLEAAPTKQLVQVIKYGAKAAKGAYKFGKKLFTKTKPTKVRVKPKPKTPSTTTLPDGTVIPFDPMRRQIINP